MATEPASVERLSPIELLGARAPWEGLMARKGSPQTFEKRARERDKQAKRQAKQADRVAKSVARQQQRHEDLVASYGVRPSAPRPPAPAVPPPLIPI